jgi:hypothetical protein
MSFRDGTGNHYLPLNFKEFEERTILYLNGKNSVLIDSKIAKY